MRSAHEKAGQSGRPVEYDPTTRTTCFPPNHTCIYPIPGRALSKGHVHLALNHGILFLDLAAAFILDTSSDSHSLARNMNFDDVEERDGL